MQVEGSEKKKNQIKKLKRKKIDTKETKYGKKSYIKKSPHPLAPILILNTV